MWGLHGSAAVHTRKGRQVSVVRTRGLPSTRTPSTRELHDGRLSRTPRGVKTNTTVRVRRTHRNLDRDMLPSIDESSGDREEGGGGSCKDILNFTQSTI